MRTVLLVDPDPFVRALLRALLEAPDQVVLEADDNAAALRALRDARGPLVAVLSARTNPTDGWQLLQAVATDQRLRQRHGYLILSKEAGWLPPSFQRLHELLILRRLEPPAFVHIAPTVARLQDELARAQAAERTGADVAGAHRPTDAPA
jgi:CheY-like chemotaxis protein